MSCTKCVYMCTRMHRDVCVHRYCKDICMHALCFHVCMCVCVCEQSEAFRGGHIQGTHMCVCGSGSSTTSHMDVDSTDASHSGQSVTQKPMTTGMTPAQQAGEGAPMIDRAIHAWYEHRV